MNWIDKAAEEICHTEHCNYLSENSYEDIANIILSHAPVIDAEALAEKLAEAHLLDGEGFTDSYDKFLCHVVSVITSSRDLNITWVEAETVRTETVASYGRFYLYACDSGVDGWTAYLCFDSHRIMEAPNLKSLELAQQACEKALKGIITGVKE